MLEVLGVGQGSGNGSIVSVLWTEILKAINGVVKSMAVMSEGLGFNLCVVPFLNVCVPNLPQG